MADGTTTDMTGGLYRRIYAGFLTGNRINAVSVGAEAWFWRLHAIADDFGNLPGNPRVMRSYAAPLRDWSLDEIVSMTGELVTQRLISRFSVADNAYYHIDGFEYRQPANKSGRRIQKYPQPGESGGALGNPGVLRPPIPIPMPIPMPSLVKTHGALQANQWIGRHVEATELNHQAGVMALFAECVSAGILREGDRLDYVATVACCRRTAKKNPVGMLRRKLGNFDMHRRRITAMDEERAASMLRSWDEEHRG